MVRATYVFAWRSGEKRGIRFWGEKNEGSWKNRWKMWFRGKIQQKKISGKIEGLERVGACAWVRPCLFPAKGWKEGNMRFKSNR